MDNLSETVTKFLSKIANAANGGAQRAGHKPERQPFCTLHQAIDCLYRGHSDMPIEIIPKSPSIIGRKILEQMWNEIGEKEEQWALTDETAARLIELIEKGHLVFKFSY